MDLQTALIDLGLDYREARIYLSLLSLGQGTVREIGKSSAMARTTVYPFLESLSSKGLIVRALDASGTAYYSPSAADAFEELIERQRQHLDRKVLIGKELSKALSPFFSKRKKFVPKIRFAEGKPAIEKLLYSALKDWRKSYERINNWTMWGYQHHTFVEEYRKWHEHAWKIRDPREQIFLFSTQQGLSQQKQDKIHNREIKQLPGAYEFPCSIWIHADHVLLGMTSSKPHFAILVVDIVIAETLRTLFRMLWEQGQA